MITDSLCTICGFNEEMIKDTILDGVLLVVIFVSLSLPFIAVLSKTEVLCHDVPK
jgi:hypothetical protein